MINEKMAADLISLGIKSDDVILMHSSLSSLGHIDGGAESVIDTLLSVLTNGTLLLPALSYSYVTDENPNFSLKDTPSCVGAINEYFRTRPGVLRSMHPTHSVCGIGRQAAQILSKHIETNTPVGAVSPFALLPEFNGKILMLGCGLRPNTSMHGVEELSKPPYLLKPDMVEYSLTDENRNTVLKKYYVHDFWNHTVVQRYNRIDTLMDIPSGKVLNAEAYLIDAKTMWQKAHEKLLENELYFVDIES